MNFGNPLYSIILGLLTAGGALALKSVFDGIGLWRDGTARTEARGIKNLERYRLEADHRADRALHVSEYRLNLADYYRQRAADLEFYIRVTYGADKIPPVQAPPPQMTPFNQLEKVEDNA
jgi:hypothetical protein